jgi:hypothetical protein
MPDTQDTYPWKEGMQEGMKEGRRAYISSSGSHFPSSWFLLNLFQFWTSASRFFQASFAHCLLCLRTLSHLFLVNSLYLLGVFF